MISQDKFELIVYGSILQAISQKTMIYLAERDDATIMPHHCQSKRKHLRGRLEILSVSRLLLGSRYQVLVSDDAPHLAHDNTVGMTAGSRSSRHPSEKLLK